MLAYLSEGRHSCQQQASGDDGYTPSSLETRLGIIGDKLAIYELIAAHPPSADTGTAEYTSSVYLEDGVFDRGAMLDGVSGIDEIAAFILRPAHEEAIRGGLAHFAGLPLIDLQATAQLSPRTS